jgi:CheY-like chemotaxis protein
MSHKPIVFYADDDPDDLQLLKTAFKDYSDDIKLMTATDGEEALEILESLPEEQTPCLIILDINMPKVNGKEALKQLRKLPRYQSLPTILFTTSNQPIDKEFAEKYNAGFITKPIEMTQLEKIADVFVAHCADEIKKNLKRNI